MHRQIQFPTVHKDTIYILSLRVVVKHCMSEGQRRTFEVSYYIDQEIEGAENANE